MDRFGLRERWSRSVRQAQASKRNRRRRCRNESPPPEALKAVREQAALVPEALAVDPFAGEQGLPPEACARCTPMS